MLRKLKDKFKSDGCTLWPDGDYRECCITHDRSYYTGGTKQAREEADYDLMCCVAVSHPIIAWIMYLGVRVFGHPIFPFPWRWGFGYFYKDSWRYDK